jgi:hypothetical protein
MEYIIDFIEIYSNINILLNPDKITKDKVEKNSLNNDITELEKQQETYEVLIRKLESDHRNHLKVI